MAKEPAPKATSEKKPVTERVSLDEFCTRLSETEKRYALIAGFAATERKARRVRDTEAAFQARFAAFIKQPA